MKQKARRKRTDHLAKILPPTVRFWTGISLIPGYFLVDQILQKFILVILFAFIAKQAGKKIRYMYFTMMILSITVFHLLSPMGRLLMEIGPFKITSGALETGFLKGITLGGLVFLSLFSVTPSLKLPGRLGGLLAHMFYYFEEILDGRKRVKASDFIGSLDTILMDIFPPSDTAAPEEAAPSEEESTRSYPFMIPYILLMEFLVWGAVFWAFRG